MGGKRLYSKISNEEYERKLYNVMKRLKVTEYTFDYSRFAAWVQFTYKGNQYHFEHSPENARAHGQKIEYGSDCFAQIVYSLEDIARMVERGIYDLQVWAAGMKVLPPPVEVPTFFRFMGFDRVPDSIEDVEARYRQLSLQMHPDQGGSSEDFQKLTDSRERAKQYFGGDRS
jgi:hypothetical protein